MPSKGFFDGQPSNIAAIAIAAIFWFVAWVLISVVVFGSPVFGLLVAVGLPVIVIFWVGATPSPYPHEESNKSK